MSASSQRIVASEVREILDRYGDALAPAPAFIRETILARLSAGGALEISQFAERIAIDLRIRGGFVPKTGCLRRNPATLRVFRGHSSGVTRIVATTPFGCGTWRPARLNRFSKGIPRKSLTSCRWGTGGRSRRPSTTPFGCGTWRPARPCGSSKGTPMSSIMSYR